MGWLDPTHPVLGCGRSPAGPRGPTGAARLNRRLGLAAPVHPTDPVSLGPTARFDYASAPRKNKALARAITSFTRDTAIRTGFAPFFGAGEEGFRVLCDHARKSD